MLPTHIQNEIDCIRHRMCEGKSRYADSVRAELAAKEHRHNTSLGVYYCPFCNFHHHGLTPSGKSAYQFRKYMTLENLLNYDFEAVADKPLKGKRAVAASELQPNMMIDLRPQARPEIRPMTMAVAEVTPDKVVFDTYPKKTFAIRGGKMFDGTGLELYAVPCKQGENPGALKQFHHEYHHTQEYATIK